MFMLYAQAIVALLDHGVPGVEFWLHVAHLRFTVNQNAFEFTSESNLALIRLYKGGGSTWKTTIPGQIIWIHAFNALIFFPFAKKWPKISFPSHILHLQMILHFSHKASLGYNIVKDFLHKFNVKAITLTKNKVKLLRIETLITIPFLEEHSKPNWFKQ